LRRTLDHRRQLVKYNHFCNWDNKLKIA
jgi:hypothetical protein